MVSKFFKNTYLNFAVILIICITASYSIVYSNIENFPDIMSGGNADVQIYLDMYEGKPVEGCECCRVLTPSLAKLLPDFPMSFFSESRNASDKYWMARIKFGVINLCFLIATGVLLFYFLKNYGFNIQESLIGSLMFYSARPVIQQAGDPMVDASAYFFLILCLYAIQREYILMFLIGFFFGLLSKESVFLALFALIFSNKKSKLKIVVLTLPLIVAYLFFRHALVRSECFLEMNYILAAKEQLYNLAHLNTTLDLFSSFSLLWIPAIFALLKHQRLPRELYHWALSIPILLLIILFFKLNLGRALFMAFPVVIPLALFGLSYFWGDNKK